MVARSVAVLEEWIAEFRARGYSIPGTVRVIPQDSPDGEDTGLVSASLATVDTVLYVQPVEVGSREWCVTFEPREDPVSLDPATVTSLASELTVLAALCAFLEAKAAGMTRGFSSR